MVSNNSANGQRASELLSALAAIVDDEARHGTLSLGDRVSTRICLEWGGQQLYLPMDKTRRNRHIYATFNGSNYHDLARRYKMSESAVRRLISDEHNRRRRKQNVLPGLERGEE